MRYTFYKHQQYQHGTVKGSYWSPQPGITIRYDKSRNKFINQNGLEIEVDTQPKDGIYCGIHDERNNDENFTHAIVPESHPAYNLIMMHRIGYYCLPNDSPKRTELYKVPTIVLDNALK